MSGLKVESPAIVDEFGMHRTVESIGDDVPLLFQQVDSAHVPYFLRAVIRDIVSTLCSRPQLVSSCHANYRLQSGERRDCARLQS